MPTVSRHYAKGRRPEAGGAQGGAPVVLMVSGGADSTALLLLACTSELDIQDGRGVARIARERLHVLHVNHHLRGAASDADEAFVRELCACQGLPLCVEHASFADLGGQNLEAAARDARYAAARRYVRELCRETGAPRADARIVTAHTASDRAETFLMNAIKGSGPAGLSSIPRRRNIIVRPLLDRTHEELVRHLQMAGQAWREDESNADTSYLRNFIRHRLMPLIEDRNARVTRAIGASCDILGDEDAFMSRLAATGLRSIIRREGEGLMVLDAARLGASEVAIARRMVRLAVERLAPEARLEMRHVEEVLGRVSAGEGSVTLPEGIDARVAFGILTLRTPRAAEAAPVGWLTASSPVPCAGGKLITCELMRLAPGQDPVALARELACADPGECTALVDVAALGLIDGDVIGLREDCPDPRVIPAAARDCRLWVDAPAPGDVVCPLGMHGRTKKLSDLLNEAHVPLVERPAVPVVRTAPGGSIVWVAGVRLDDRFRCTATSRVLLKLNIRPVEGA